MTTEDKIQAGILIARGLFSLGVDAAGKIRSVFKSAGVEATPDEHDQIVRAVQQDARERQQLAKEDAAAARRENQTDPPEPAE